MEAKACAGGPVVIVGGGNSAGQAAIYLARTCTDVRIVIRSESLASSMSRYLIDQIERHPHIHISPRTEVTALIGDQKLEGVNLSLNPPKNKAFEAYGPLSIREKCLPTWESGV